MDSKIIYESEQKKLDTYFNFELHYTYCMCRTANKGNKMEKITIFILKDESGYSLVSSNGADYGVVADDLKNAIGMAKEIISDGFADQFCVDE